MTNGFVATSTTHKEKNPQIKHMPHDPTLSAYHKGSTESMI